MIVCRLPWLAALLLACPIPGQAAVHTLRSTADELVVELHLPGPELVEVKRHGRAWVDLALPLAARLQEAGKPALPYFAELIAAPPGSRLQVEVEPLHYLDFTDVDFVLADGTAGGAGPMALPEGLAETEPLGRLRGVETHALRLFPVRYDGHRLRVYDRLRVRVGFLGGRVEKGSRPPERGAGAALYGALLNGEQATSWARHKRWAPAARTTVDDWYDPAMPWIKVFVQQDGLYRIDAEWLEKRDLDLTSLDPATLRLFNRGREQPIYVAGEADGHFDPDDFLIFHGRYRRDETRDFESLFGRRNVYWLTWGGATGWHHADRDAAPVHEYPMQRAYWTTRHFEQDTNYDPFPSAPDNERDHWMWDASIFATKPDLPSSRTFAGDLNALETRTGYAARIRVALHGLGGLGHHTVVQLNNVGLDDNVIDDTIWEGQTEHFIDAEIPASYLKRGTNRLLVKAFADQTKHDRVYTNWFEIDYFRLYQTVVGYLEFPQPASDGHRITLTGFKHPAIELYDLTSGGRLVGADLDTLGSEFAITFEDVAPVPGRYVAGDSLSLLTPTGLRDQPSDLRGPGPGADYLILTHVRFAGAAEHLAAHRQRDGLTTMVVDVEDIYDEFSHGLLSRAAIRDFVAHAYHVWEHPPAYLLLLGTTTFDHRNIEGANRPTFVPTQYYHARNRGHAPSDYLYALQEGDDQLPDLAVGRLLVESGPEADLAVERIIAYDLDPAGGDWRRRVVYAANHHQSNFIGPSQALASTYTQPLGLEARNIFNTVDDAPLPNFTGMQFIEEFSRGALLVNYAGHGSAGSMDKIFGVNVADWGYLAKIDNGRRRPLVLALSCLNGMFTNPKEAFLSLAEVLTTKEEGGAIAYISASATSFVAQNNLLSQDLFDAYFSRGQLQFGPTLNGAKARVLAAHPSWDAVVLTMQLFGAPAQQLALPPGPDYEATHLASDADPLFGQTTVSVGATLANNGTLGADSVDVALRVGDSATTDVDTVWSARLPPFAGTLDLDLPWSTAARRGPQELELLVDPAGEVPEEEEDNNRITLSVQLFEPLIPVSVWPPDAAVLDAGVTRLTAAAPHSRPDARIEFALSAETDGRGDLLLEQTSATDGVATVTLDPALEAGDYYWETRVLTADGTGPWSKVATFTSGGQRGHTWGQRGRQLLGAIAENLKLEADALAIAASTRPFRPSDATREDGFTVRDLNGAGVLATDGTYLYAKRWYNDESNIYPGDDFFARVGTGYGDTRRDLKYDVLADSTTAGISATYHSDGYIYNDSGRAYELERIDAETGRLDTVQVPDGLLEWQSGLVIEGDEVFRGHSLITSDGTYIYNAAMSSEKGMRTEWSFRVFDPAAGWALVRSFTSPPTANGFTFKWTAGLLADGERLYLIEHSGERRIRMIDAFDGRFLDEWTSDQDLTRIITGQYDWVNNKVWLGDLHGSAIFRYTGLEQVREGEVTSPSIGPTDVWHSLSIDGTAVGLAVDVLAPAADGGWQPLDEFTALPAAAGIDLAGLDATRYPSVRLRARLDGDANPDAALVGWSVDYDRLPSLQLAAVEAGTDSTGLWVEAAVRNLTPFDVAGATLALLWDNRQQPVAEFALPALPSGASQRIRLDNLDTPPLAVDLFARVTTARPDADPTDNLRRVPLLFGGRAPIAIRLWPTAASFVDGDPIAPGQGLVVGAPTAPGDTVTLQLDGEPIKPDSLLPAASFDAGPRPLFRPQLADGRYELTVALWRDGERVGARIVHFVISTELVLRNALVYPNPVSAGAAFTFALSHDATAAVDIYALSGRLVRQLPPLLLPAGFAQVWWDGRDDGGQPVASGTYLFRVEAVAGERRVEASGPFVVMR